MRGWFRGFGGLRLTLATLSALLVVLGPFSGGTVSFDGVDLVTTLLAPVGFAIFVFMLPLDMAMTAVFMTDASPEKRSALKRVLVTEAVLLVALVLAWLPFLLRLRLR